MIGLNVLFWILVILFAFIGMNRGWAKELLVTFSVILALFIIMVLEHYVPFIRDNLITGQAQFWFRFAIVMGSVFFGYQTPNLPRLAATNRFVRERLQDSLLGIFLGALNGFMIFGTLLYYMSSANYPFSFIAKPPSGPIADAIIRLIPFMPPNWLGIPTVYFAVALAFGFVLVVFI